MRRVPILTVTGGDNPEQMPPGSNPRPEWSRDMMDQIRGGTVKRVRYWDTENVDTDADKPEAGSQGPGREPPTVGGPEVRDNTMQKPAKRPRRVQPVEGQEKIVDMLKRMSDKLLDETTGLSQVVMGEGLGLVVGLDPGEEVKQPRDSKGTGLSQEVMGDGLGLALKVKDDGLMDIVTAVVGEDKKATGLSQEVMGDGLGLTLKANDGDLMQEGTALVDLNFSFN